MNGKFQVKQSVQHALVARQCAPWTTFRQMGLLFAIGLTCLALNTRLAFAHPLQDVSTTEAPAPAAPDSLHSPQVYNWQDVPEGEKVPVKEVLFDAGGYQVVCDSGDKIVVPFVNENTNVMKFGRSDTQDCYFVKDGSHSGPLPQQHKLAAKCDRAGRQVVSDPPGLRVLLSSLCRSRSYLERLHHHGLVSGHDGVRRPGEQYTRHILPLDAGLSHGHKRNGVSLLFHLPRLHDAPCDLHSQPGLLYQLQHAGRAGLGQCRGDKQPGGCGNFLAASQRLGQAGCLRGKPFRQFGHTLGVAAEFSQPCFGASWQWDPCFLKPCEFGRRRRHRGSYEPFRQRRRRRGWEPFVRHEPCWSLCQCSSFQQPKTRGACASEKHVEGWAQTLVHRGLSASVVSRP